MEIVEDDIPFRVLVRRRVFSSPSQIDPHSDFDEQTTYPKNKLP